jgi:hypothetical protein
MAFFHSALSTDSARCALFLSPSAAAIDKSFARIKEEVREDLLVRLLEVPAYHVVALWICDERRKTSQVLVISSPANSNLKRDRILTSREFLEALHSQRHIGGIGSANRRQRDVIDRVHQGFGVFQPKSSCLFQLILSLCSQACGQRSGIAARIRKEGKRNLLGVKVFTSGC